MGLFSESQIAEINKVAAKSKELLDPPKVMKSKSMSSDLAAMSQSVIDYFPDSSAILITDIDSLHDYITHCIESGCAGIDTETTGLDRIKDTIVGASLYYPGGVECYIPSRHLIPIFDEPYRGQLSYENIGEEFQRLADSDIKLIFANADFDLAMIYKDFKVDLNSVCYYDVILAWRCLKENEKDNSLKALYNKYVLKGKGDPKKFSDFFTPQMFPYCKPEVAKLYAANDAKITYELFKWQLPYITKDDPKCIKNHLEKIADIVWNVEFPLIKVCQNMHRTGVYLDKDIAKVLLGRYKKREIEESEKLAGMVDDIIEKYPRPSSATRPPFLRGSDFNPKSPPHVKYLLYTLMNLPKGKDGESTDKSVLHDMNLPVTEQILKVRGIGVLMSTFVEKLPNSTTPDSRIHATFKQIGAGTGRFSSESPNMQNIPSHAVDIRHMFRASPGYVMLSCDYSAQEPRVTAYISHDPNMIDAFKKGRDIYASIASLAFHVPYEKCLEFHPETGEYQADGKERRGQAKFIVLGICYGRSVPSIAEQLFGTRTDMSEEEKTKEAQKVYDAVLNAFPNLRKLMIESESFAKSHGFVETMLGRRRHLPDIRLDEFEFKPLSGYVNPDVDPLDPATLQNRSEIPDRIVKQLSREFSGYKYFGQIARRTRELYENDHIRVINNRPKINDARRQLVNSRVQGSAADLTKLAMLRLSSDPNWTRIGGRLLVCIHDELLVEVPIDNYQEGADILESAMLGAADFMPFPSKCDVTTSFRWYGLEYPCKYKRPESLENLSMSEIQWVQYHLHEMEYELPVFTGKNGEKPRGDAALGVNGLVSDAYFDAIKHYKAKFHLESDSEFIEHIEHRVTYGN